jgi:iron complex outermembrane recepter protein
MKKTSPLTLTRYTLVSVFLLLTLALSAQTTIKGKITTLDTKDPITGATIGVKGTSIGATSDINGNYVMKVPESAGNFFIISVSYVGFLTLNEPITLVAEAELTRNFSMKEGTALGEVIVSANKKTERLQDVAMSISVLTPKELQRTGATQFRDYASSIPNLAFGTQGGGGAFNDGRTSNQISLRGITGANTTAMYLDETPLPANIDPRLVDVARVEVLRGPQGTLYGSSTMGGAVKVVTNQPNIKQQEGSFSLSTGSVAEGTLDYGMNGMINLPLLKDKIAFRAIAFYDYQTGVYDRVASPFKVNILNKGSLTSDISGAPATIKTDNCLSCAPSNKENVDAKTAYGFQASLGFYPIKNLSFVPKVIYQTQSGLGYDFADLSPKNFKQFRSSSVEEKFSDTWTHFSLLSNYNFESGKIVSSTSYIDRTYTEQEDEGQFLSTLILAHDAINPDFWAGVITRDGRFKKFVQELRFQSEFKGNLNMIAGIYYGNENLVEAGNSKKLGFLPYLGSPLPDSAQWFKMDNDQKVQETAFFGELYYDLTKELRVTAGIRYFSATSKRSYAATGAPYDFDITTISQDITESGFNPKLNLTYKFNKDVLVYGTISKGYRLGGLNAPLPPVWCKKAIDSLLGGKQPPSQYGSDFLWNYEAGIKSIFSDGKIIVNASIFYNDWSNLQQRRFFPDCGLGFVSNVGSASSTGLELEVNAKPTNWLDLGFGLGLLNAKIKETGTGLDAKVGDRILFTPNTTLSGMAQFTKEMKGGNQFFFRINTQYVGERNSSFGLVPDAKGNLIKDPARILEAYTLMNMRIGYQTKSYEANLFCNNVTGEQANYGDVTSLAAEVPGRPRYMTNRPRTIGIMLKTYF